MQYKLSCVQCAAVHVNNTGLTGFLQELHTNELLVSSGLGRQLGWGASLEQQVGRGLMCRPASCCQLVLVCRQVGSSMQEVPRCPMPLCMTE